MLEEGHLRLHVLGGPLVHRGHGTLRRRAAAVVLEEQVLRHGGLLCLGPRQARPKTQETTMPKYLLLKHYRGGPAPQRPVPPMDQWAPEDVEAQMAFLKHSRAGLSRASTTQRAARGERRVRRRTGAHAGAHLGACLL